MIIGPVNLTQIDLIWPNVAPWVEQATLKGRSNRTMPALYAQVRNGSLWMAIAAHGPELDQACGVALVDISDVEGERILQHVVVAGKPDEAHEWWIAELLDWPFMRTMGITKVVSEGRAGWTDMVKRIKPQMRVVRVVMEWQLDVGAP